MAKKIFWIATVVSICFIITACINIASFADKSTFNANFDAFNSAFYTFDLLALSAVLFLFAGSVSEVAAANREKSSKRPYSLRVNSKADSSRTDTAKSGSNKSVLSSAEEDVDVEMVASRAESVNNNNKSKSGGLSVLLPDKPTIDTRGKTRKQGNKVAPLSPNSQRSNVWGSPSLSAQTPTTPDRITFTPQQQRPSSTDPPSSPKASDDTPLLPPPLPLTI
jgi:hypothetical protein